MGETAKQERFCAEHIFKSSDRQRADSFLFALAKAIARCEQNIQLKEPERGQGN